MLPDIDHYQILEVHYGHRVEDRAWVKEFYDAAVDWWGESWYEGENLKSRLDQVERFAGKAPKKLLELGAGTERPLVF
jgi:hypothetical protein